MSLSENLKLTLSYTPHTHEQERLNNELQQLVKDIWRVGDSDKPEVPFGVLFDDDDVQQHYEGLAATLKAAKKREYYYGNNCHMHGNLHSLNVSLC